MLVYFALGWWAIQTREGPLHEAFVWFLILIPLPWYAHLWLQHRRRQERELRFWRGKCLRCGYDVRGQGELCTECGDPLRPKPIQL
jgi:hypothetical protein